jgi:DNA helicase MCM8
VVGIVKLKQTGAPRPASSFHGDRKESAVHQIYIDGISMVAIDVNEDHDEDTSSLNEQQQRREDAQFFSADEIRRFQQIKQAESCLGLLATSLCPQIFGHTLVKVGLLLGLVGGTKRVPSSPAGAGGVNIRHNIHILLIGDPGIGKV